MGYLCVKTRLSYSSIFLQRLFNSAKNPHVFIQNQKTLSDRELVQEISENPYLQYFLGFSGFVIKKPFDSSLMVHFRKRLGMDIINEINELIAIDSAKPKDTDDNDDNDDHSGDENALSTEGDTETPDPNVKKAGTLLLDATCTPADIHYPTDLWLLNDAREALEEIIDVLHGPHIGSSKKPRTYRINARKSYLNIDKKKRKTKKEIRKGIGKQLRYIKRGLKVIKVLVSKSSLTLLNSRQYRNLLVCSEVYRQQLEMFKNGKHQTDDRIVSLHMPFIRPIVRGKTSADVEFGAKLAISTVNGFSFMEHLSFDAFNEGTTLIASIKNYRRRFGVYPESVVVDKIYRNREYIAFCKSWGIRISGPPLGRPTKDADLLRAQKREERADAKIRNRVEAAFGEGKRFYGLGQIMARLKDTS